MQNASYFGLDDRIIPVCSCAGDPNLYQHIKGADTSLLIEGINYVECTGLNKPNFFKNLANQGECHVLQVITDSFPDFSDEFAKEFEKYFQETRRGTLSKTSAGEVIFMHGYTGVSRQPCPFS